MRADRCMGLLLRALAVVLVLFHAGAHAQDLPEYRLKAAFVYNFALFTEWPADAGDTLNLCIHGIDPFGAEIDPLDGKKVGARTLVVRRLNKLEALKGCQIVFIAKTGDDQIRRIVDALRGEPVLTVADTPVALQHGVVLNMNVTQSRVTFEVNLKAARAARLDFSSRLLRLATEVLQ